MKTIAGVVTIITVLAAETHATEHRVSSAAEIERLVGALQPGDEIVMSDGTWADQKIVFAGTGATEIPITLRAATDGKVTLKGKSSLEINGEHLVVRGLHLQDGQMTGDGIRISGRHCRLTESAITGGAYKFFVHLSGSEHRVDHCYVAGKTSDSPTLQVEVEDQPNHHQIDHNHFGPRPPLGRNGGETIRIGYSHQSMRDSGTVVEHNLFDRCDGELEIISNKSCGNVYRSNTFLDCAGMLTLRHGNNCVVDGNFFFGKHKRGSGGVRVIGEDHVVTNNYIDGVLLGGIWITAGIPNSPLVGYFQARNCLIAFNTIVDSQGPCLELDAGYGRSGRSLRPEHITIANNLLSPAENEPLIKGVEGANFKWAGNVVTTRGALESLPPGIIEHDPKLKRADDGWWRPTNRSIGADIEGIGRRIVTDIDGQERGEQPEVGCDQISDSPVKIRPLNAKDVGPAWRRTP